MMKATWETNSLAEPMDDSGRCSPAPDALWQWTCEDGKYSTTEMV
jgi:hypothetical protein